jgi:hypothetical protein
MRHPPPRKLLPSLAPIALALALAAALFHERATAMSGCFPHTFLLLEKVTEDDVPVLTFPGPERIRFSAGPGSMMIEAEDTRAQVIWREVFHATPTPAP